MKKFAGRKWYAFLIIEGLTQYYFIFGILNQDNWWKATLGLLLFYFCANVFEGMYGKEKNNSLLDPEKPQ